VITSENWIVHFDLKRLCFLRELNLYTSSNFIFLIFLNLNLSARQVLQQITLDCCMLPHCVYIHTLFAGLKQANNSKRFE
jgi:hypothetical protein